MGAAINNCLTMRKLNSIDQQRQSVESNTMSGITYDKGTFIQFNTVDKFKDNYLIG